jgi:hypothetical protein
MHHFGFYGVQEWDGIWEDGSEEHSEGAHSLVISFPVM